MLQIDVFNKLFSADWRYGDWKICVLKKPFWLAPGKTTTISDLV